MKAIFKWRISSKIMAAIMVCSAALAAVIGSVSLYQASNVIEKKAYDNLELTAKFYAGEFGKTAVMVESVLNSYLASLDASFDMQRAKEKKDAYIKEYQEKVIIPLTGQYAFNTRGILGIYFDVDPSMTPQLKENEHVYGAWYLDKYRTGKIIRENLEIKKNFYKENKEMEWYYASINKGSGVWSKPYKDIYTGYYMISYNKPLYIEGKLIGVAGIDIVFEDLMKMIQKASVYDTGFASLLGSDYDIIVHPQVDYEEKAHPVNIIDLNPEYVKLTEAIGKNASGIVSIGADEVFSFSRMDNGYIVVLEAKKSEILEQLNRVRALMDAIILVGIIIAAFIAYFLGRYISKPVDTLQKEIQKMIHFNFTESERNLHGNSGDIVCELAQMRKTVSNSIEMFKNNSSIIAVKGEELGRMLSILEDTVDRMEIMHENSVAENAAIESSISIQREIIGEMRKSTDALCKTNDSNIKIADLYKIK